MENLNTKNFYNTIEEYKKFNELLPKNYMHMLYKQYRKGYNSKSGLSRDIYYKFIIQNRITLFLCNRVKKEDIDIEIYLIEKYIPILDYIFNKLKLNKTDINKEDVIIKSIETYDGVKMFSLHILDTLRDSFINTPNKVLTKTNNN